MSAVQRVLDAIEEFKKGRMVIMVDDEDRENEGDLVYASVFSTPEHVNFMATHAKGLICVAINSSIAKRLHLEPMVKSNTSMHETAFTISVDATAATTGISTAERDMTIKILANPISQPQELVAPGHIFPLIAKDGGVLMRSGHTEAAVDLCKLANLPPVGVICELANDDGTVMRGDQIKAFGETHKIRRISVADLIAYRQAREKLVERVATFPVKTEIGFTKWP